MGLPLSYDMPNLQGCASDRVRGRPEFVLQGAAAVCGGCGVLDSSDGKNWAEPARTFGEQHFSELSEIETANADAATDRGTDKWQEP